MKENILTRAFKLVVPSKPQLTREEVDNFVSNGSPKEILLSFDKGMMREFSETEVRTAIANAYFKFAKKYDGKFPDAYEDGDMPRYVKKFEQWQRESGLEILLNPKGESLKNQVKPIVKAIRQVRKENKKRNRNMDSIRSLIQTNKDLIERGS